MGGLIIHLFILSVSSAGDEDAELTADSTAFAAFGDLSPSDPSSSKTTSGYCICAHARISSLALYDNLGRTVQIRFHGELHRK